MASRRRTTRKARTTKPKARSTLPIRYAGGNPHDYRGEKVVHGVRVRT